MNEQEHDEGNQWDDEPRHCRAPDDERQSNGEEEQDETCGRQTTVMPLVASSLVTARGQARSVGRVYGRTFPSAFHK